MGLGVDLTPLKHLGKLVDDLPKDLAPLKDLPAQMEQMVNLLTAVEAHMEILVGLQTRALQEKILN